MPLLLLCLLPFSINANERENKQLFLKFFDRQDGLDQAPIESLFLDDAGILWIGTTWGLRFFDGFQAVSATGLPPGSITSMSGEDSDLWVWVEGAGLFRRNQGVAFIYQTTPLEKDLPVFLFHHDGLIRALQNDQLYTFDHQWDPFDLPSPAQKASSWQGGIWLEAKDRLLHVINGRVSSYPFNQQTPHAILATESGDVWLGEGSQLSIFRPTTASRIKHLSVAGNIKDIVRHEGWLWIRHDEGLTRYDPKLNHIQDIKTSASAPPQSLIARGEHVFWGMKDRLAYFNSAFDQLNVIAHNAPSRIQVLQSNSPQELWLGLENGLYSINNERFFPLQKGLSQGVRAILPDKDRVWLGLERGLGCLAPDSELIEFHDLSDAMANQPVDALCLTDQGLWVGGKKGAHLLEPDSKMVQRAFLQASVLDFLSTSQHFLIATNRGLWLEDSETHWKAVNKQKLPSKLTGLIEDHMGDIWVSSHDGIFSLDGTDLRLKRTLNNLPHTQITSIHLDRGGSIWATSPTGLIKINPITGEASRVASWIKQNMVGYTNPNAYQLLFSDGHCVFQIDPHHQSLPSAPQPHINSLSWYEDKKRIEVSTPCTSIPTDHESLQLKLSFGHNFANSNAPQWRRKESPVDWQSFDGHQINLGTLPPGGHTILVKSSLDASSIAVSYLQVSPSLELLWWALPVFVALFILWALQNRRKVVVLPEPSPQGPEFKELNSRPKVREKSEPLLLVVDDDAMNLRVIKDLLDGQGYQILTAQDGTTALELCERPDIDLVLLDIMMPGMSGFEVCRHLRQQWSVQDLPILFLTARVSKDDLVRGFEAGGNDYLTKPIVAEELKARLALHLQLKQIHHLVLQEKQLLKTKVELEQEKLLSREASLRLLHVQMNPHFLQNALNTVSWFCISDPEGARDMLNILSRFLRQTYNATPQSETTLAEELERIDLFCQIQQLRFKDRLRTQMDIEADTRSLVLPNFLIQPLVENAILHGVEKNKDINKVLLSCHIVDKKLRVEIINNGSPLKTPLEEMIQDDHSLGNIHQRLQLMFDTTLFHRYDQNRHHFGFEIPLKHLRRSPSPPGTPE